MVIAETMYQLGYLAYLTLLLCSVSSAQRFDVDPNAPRPRPPGFRGPGGGPVVTRPRPVQFPQGPFPQRPPYPTRGPQGPYPGRPPVQNPRVRPLPRPRPNPIPVKPAQKCTSFKIRKEWRTLSESEQQAYLAALRCMMKLPTKAAKVMKPPGLVTRFDDFSFTHITLADKVHYVGQFLPWHRYFLNLFEEALRSDCGYQGTQPYWDWNLDTADFANSPVFDPVKGFGGNGAYKPLPKDFKVDPRRKHMMRFMKTQEDLQKRSEEAAAAKEESNEDPWATPKKPKKITPPKPSDTPAMNMPMPNGGGLPNNWQEVMPTNSTPTDRSHTGGGCISNGLFFGVNVTLGIGDTLEMNPRCLVRDFMPQFAAQSASTKNIRNVLSQPTYGHMFSNLDTLHEAGHGGVGGYLGDMANLYSSSVDPLFYLHHANLDRFWWSWQALDLKRRLYDVSGPSTYHGPVNISLSFPLEMGVSGKLVLIRDVMDTRSSPWCVAYDKVYTL